MFSYIYGFRWFVHLVVPAPTSSLSRHRSKILFLRATLFSSSSCCFTASIMTRSPVLIILFFNRYELFRDLTGFCSGNRPHKGLGDGFIVAFAEGRIGNGVIISTCFPLDLTIFFKPMQILSNFQFILMERVLDVLHAVIKFIEEELKFVNINFPLIDTAVLWLMVLMANYSKSDRMSQRNASQRLSMFIIIITVYHICMKIRVQLVENSPLHRVPSLFLNFNRVQFVFNVIPSLLRHKRLHKINLHNSSHIFFTKNSVEAMGGLPNYLLFRSGTEHSNEAVANNIYLYGNTQMIGYLQKLRFKLGYKAMRFSFTNWKQTKYRFGVSSLPLFNKIKSDPQLPRLFVRIQDYLRQKCNKRDYFDSRYNISSDKNKYITINWVHFHTNALDIYPVTVISGSNTYTNYVCLLSQKVGGQDVNLEMFMKKTNITTNKDIKIFMNQGFIEKNGVVYQKKDFLFQKNYKPKNILIFHYNTVDSVEELLSNALLKNYFQNKNQTGLVIHIIEDLSLIQTPVFQLFISQFQQDVEHVWYNQELHNVSNDQTLLQQNLLELETWNKVFPEVVKNTFEQRMKYYQCKHKNKIESLFPNLNNSLYQRLFNFVNNEEKGYQYVERKQMKPKVSRIKILQDTILKNIDRIKQLHKLVPQSEGCFQPKVTILGTNSSMPLISRNPPGILVSMNEKHNILLDCGEQTLEQMANHFSPPQYEEELMKVKVLFITHIHSDNNLGLCNFISERKRLLKSKGRSQKMFLFIPFNVLNWYAQFNSIIQDLSQNCELIFIQVYNSEMKGSNEKNVKVNKDNFKVSFYSELQHSARTKNLANKELPFQKKRIQEFQKFLQAHSYIEFKPIEVVHCPEAYGIVIKNEHFKVSYSGDTRPCQKFQEAASESDVLIHEATFNDDEAQKAAQFKHSTIEEGIQLGKNSNSKKLVLTHFSSKIKIPEKLTRFTQNTSYFNEKTIFAFDHLQIPFKKNDHLPQITKFISKINEQVNNRYEKQDN